MDTVQIVQIVLIPLITMGLTILWESVRDSSKRKNKKDREIYEELKETFEGDWDLVWFFRDHTVGNLTNTEYISQIEKVLRKLNRPGFLFSRNDLEKHRKYLLEKIEEFLSLTMINFFSHPKDDNFYVLKYYFEAEFEMDPNAQKKFEQLIKKIDGLGTEIYNTYKELSDRAQKRL